MSSGSMPAGGVAGASSDEWRRARTDRKTTNASSNATTAILIAGLPERHSRRRAPDLPPTRIQIHARSEVRIVQRTKIPHVAAKTDVLIEESHHAEADVIGEIVVRPRLVEKGSSLDVRSHQPEATGDERPDAGAVRAADRHAQNGVAHHRDRADVAEHRIRSEEFRRVPDVSFETKHAGAHVSGDGAEGNRAVIRAGGGVGADPGTDVAVGARLNRKPDDHRRRYEHTSFREAAHAPFPRFRVSMASRRSKAASGVPRRTVGGTSGNRSVEVDRLSACPRERPSRVLQAQRT